MTNAEGTLHITLQRRNLQLRRGPRGAGRRWLALALGHRSHPAGVCALGRGLPAAAARHVCVRDLGQPPPGTVPGARSTRHQTAVLLQFSPGRLHVWLGGPRAAGQQPRPTPAGRRRAAGLPDVPVAAGGQTLIQDVRMLPAGCWMRVAADGRISQQRYWDLFDTPTSPGRSWRPPGSGLHELLRQSAALHLVSDVPVAVFLRWHRLQRHRRPGARSRAPSAHVLGGLRRTGLRRNRVRGARRASIRH